jgi:hypothetical protein
VRNLGWWEGLGSGASGWFGLFHCALGEEAFFAKEGGKSRGIAGVEGDGDESQG